MQTVIRGQNITLEAHYETGAGDLTDPFNPRLDILDPLGVQTVIGAIPTRISLGIYQYVHHAALDALTGVWSVAWQGTVSGQGLGPLSDFFQVDAIGVIVPAINGSYTYDPRTDIGYLRLHTDDRDLTQTSAALPLERRSVIFTDEELQVFLDASGGDKNYAVARVLMVIANNRSLLIQNRKVGRTNVDFGSIRSDLLKSAQSFIEMSNQAPADGYAEIVWDDFTLRRVLTNAALRERR